MMENIGQARALRVTRIGVFAALYSATSLVPISVFIGAPSFLALNLIVTPALAFLLSPIEAFFASLFGSIAAFYVAPFQAMFGPFTILLPVAGSTFGSLVCHRKEVGAFITATYLLAAISAYLVRNYPFPYFVGPHSLAIVVALATLFRKKMPFGVRVPLYAFVSTMCEQGMMMIFAVHLLGLPWQVFPGILPLMIYERVVGTVGGAMIIFALMKAIPKYFAETLV